MTLRIGAGHLTGRQERLYVQSVPETKECAERKLKMDPNNESRIIWRKDVEGKWVAGEVKILYLSAYLTFLYNLETKEISNLLRYSIDGDIIDIRTGAISELLDWLKGSIEYEISVNESYYRKMKENE